ncbi:Glycosyl transferase family 2 [Planctomycetales bacterium 10988]|nr:Glycosyl transferase family 2 [Planctomycetales bacterium 10988]
MITIEVFILNYNGQALLPRCLPSILAAAKRVPWPCRVTVIDNDSTDQSVAWLAQHHPEVTVIPQPNRGLCSFNPVLAKSNADVAVLLNNDVQLSPNCLKHLIRPLLPESNKGDSSTSEVLGRCTLTAPRCFLMTDNVENAPVYEGLKTAVRWRSGLVQATSWFPGYEKVSGLPDETAVAGSVFAVDRRRFVELGGFDAIFLPGRIEDLDFCYRAYLAGDRLCYVPDAIAYHWGAATFSLAYGETGCLRLAYRNTLLFQWLRLRDPAHRLRQLFGISLRILREVGTCWWKPHGERWLFTGAFLEACHRYFTVKADISLPRQSSQREKKFFARFSPRCLANPSSNSSPGDLVQESSPQELSPLVGVEGQG